MFKALALASVTWLLAGSTAFADVQLTIRNGQVSLVAKDATLRQILTEWARVGQTKIVNLERIPGGPLTLELKNVSERQALDVLLRSVSGYVVAPRPAAVANASAFDRIIVMPTSTAPPAAGGRTPAATPTFSQPAPAPFQPQPFRQPAEDDTTAADQEPLTPNPAGAPGGPVFNTFPQPQVVNPQPQGVAAPVPGLQGQPTGADPGQPTPPASAQPSQFGVGAAVPGMIVQPPPQPGTRAQPAPGRNP